MTVSTSELFELLKASNDFSELSAEVLLELAKSLRLETVPGGTKFMKEGSDADS